jgi:hypothetical protein
MSGEAGGHHRQALHDEVIRFNAEAVAGLRDRPRPDCPSFLDEG